MEFIKKNKLLVILSLVVLTLLIIVSIFIISFTKNNNIVAPDNFSSPDIEEESIDEYDEHSHEHYIPDIDSVFDDGNKEATISNISFKSPVTHKNATHTGSGSILYGGAGDSILVLQYGGELYLYNTADQSTFVIERNVTFGAIEPDDSYVFYTKYADGVIKEEQKIMVLDKTKTSPERKQVGTLPKGYSVKNAAFHNGLFFYYASDLSRTNSIIDVVAVNESLTTNQNTFKKLLSNHNFTQFKKCGDRLYAFDKNTQAIYDITNGSAIQKVSVPTKNLANFAILNDNIFLSYYKDNAIGEAVYELNGVNMNDIFNAVDYPVWLDVNNLLYTDTSNLYVFNLNNQSSSALFHAGIPVYTDQNKIFIQDQEDTSYISTIEIVRNQ